MKCTNLREYYFTRCLAYSGRILFDKTITYGEAWEYALGRAGFLQRKGFRKGDVIGILAANSAEWCITYMALTVAGIAVLPLDPNLSDKDYKGMMKAVRCRAVFVSPEHRKRLPSVKLFDVALDKCMGNFRAFSDVPLSSDDPASYSFTSGTTGEPKIVTLTHSNVFSAGIGTSERTAITPDDLFLCLLPLFHSYAFIANFIGGFNRGASFVFLRSLKGPDIVRALAEHPVTVFPAAPQLWELFMDSILSKAKGASRFKYSLLKFFLSTQPLFRCTGFGFIPWIVFRPIRKIFGAKMRFLVSGGAPLKKRYARYYSRMGLTIVEGYGLTETTGPISIAHPKKNKAGSVGPLLPGNFVRLTQVNRDGIGEICLKGVSVTPGYYKNSALNKKAFDADGYFLTGDLGRVDKDGYLYLTGRSKDTIVLDSGKNVYPAELEAYYKQSDAIGEICVFGRKVKGRTAAWAAIVPSKKDRESFARVRREIARLNRLLPSYKIISGFSLSLDPLPKNSTRKILVHEVVKLVAAGKLQESEDAHGSSLLEFAPENATEAKVAALLKKKARVHSLKANELLYEIGMDSLGLVDFISRCEEELGLFADSALLQETATVAELVRLIASSAGKPAKSIDDEILTSPLKFSVRGIFNPFVDLTFWLIAAIARTCWKAQFNREKLNLSNSIIAANHSSFMDSVLLLGLLPRKERRKIWTVAKREVSFLRFIFPGINALFVDRGGDLIPSMKGSADILRQDRTLLIFPEGTRSFDGRLQPFKSGAAYLAYNLGKKISPVIISGAHEAMPRGKNIPRFFSGGKITLTALSPLDPAHFASPDKLNAELEKRFKEGYKRTDGKTVSNKRTSSRGKRKK